MLLPPILVLLLVSIASALKYNPGHPICEPTKRGTCSLSWAEYEIDVPSWYNPINCSLFYHAWVYDHNCNQISDSDRPVPGTELTLASRAPNFFPEAFPPMYQIDLSPTLPEDLIFTGYRYNCRDGVEGMIPCFKYAGKQSGGRSGCKCTATGLGDKNGMPFWVCQCKFKC
ncbi:hypothetical protein PVAG01_04642 [Phlyctema vagabunda]|uniref:Uncharacterized protein n=1 Tax=Phlyctema vagabunda TaxID=108571 RepID=A0ABR4PHT5_9HELO